MKLETSRLGQSDLEITKVGIGTAPLGSTPGWRIYWGPQDESEAIRTIETALDLGVNWIDTAPFYGWGGAERIVGKALQGKRDKAYIFTKCGTLQKEQGGEREDLSPASIRRELETSLGNLHTDYIDLYQFHDPDPNTPIEESWTAMQTLIKEGKVRYGGLSKHTIGVLCWSPLASGFLADGFDLDNLDPNDFRRGRPYAQEPTYSRLKELRDVLQKIAQDHNKTMAQLALAWVLRRPAVSGAINGIRSPQEALAIPGSINWKLTDQELQTIEEALAFWNQA